jgi:predicted regulator of Ras-like GTPase activity (Roadblock/LC7/MglB family)
VAYTNENVRDKNKMNDMELRTSRLTFYQDDITKIEKVMEEFLKLSQAKSVLLVDKDGHMITRVGSEIEFNHDTISALVAGSFAATKEMAKILGEDEFSALFHQGERDNIMLSLVGDRTILTVIFDESTTLGMIRLYVSETVTKLNDVFLESKKSQEGKVPDKTLSNDYSESAKSTLDNLFDGES